MKTLKLMIFFATALGFASCSSDEAFDNIQPIDPENTVTLTADMAQFASGDTRTSINSSKQVVWSAGDQIEVYNAEGTYHKTFTLKTGAESTTATFVGEWNSENGVPAASFYPASECTSYSDTTGFTADIDNHQIYTEGTVSNGAFPMVGTITGSAISFKNAFGILKLSLKGTDAVHGLILTDYTNPLAGTFTIALDGTTTKSTAATALTYKAFLDCASSVTLNTTTATDFYIAVPAGSLSNGFDVQVLNSYGHPMASLNTSADNSIIRNKIKAMPEKTITFSTLPAGYTEVASLTSESATNQPYIDPLCKLTNSTAMEILVNTTSEESTLMAGIHSHFSFMKVPAKYTSIGDLSYGFRACTSMTGYLYLISNIPWTSGSAIMNLVYDSSTIKGYVRGYYVGLSTPKYNLDQILGGNIGLFCCFNEGSTATGAYTSAFNRGDVTIYYCSITGATDANSGNGNRLLIPCLRDSDSKPGMYDLENGVFYTNANTGADFTWDTTGNDEVSAKQSESFTSFNSKY